LSFPFSAWSSGDSWLPHRPMVLQASAAAAQRRLVRSRSDGEWPLSRRARVEEGSFVRCGAGCRSSTRSLLLVAVLQLCCAALSLSSSFSAAAAGWLSLLAA
jgi:hypothetical protein